jgi:hypothetical protein
MHPTIQYEIAKTLGAELRREAEQDRIARAGRAPARARSQAVPGPMARRLRRTARACPPPSCS